jgi:hypothetical protein
VQCCTWLICCPRVHGKNTAAETPDIRASWKAPARIQSSSGCCVSGRNLEEPFHPCKRA